jgi:thiosulfate dehydrogenase
MLTLQEAWDVSAWIDSHPRPQDPRDHGGLKATIRKFHHNRKIDYYGKTVDGHVLGAPSPKKAGQNSEKPAQH